LRFESLTRNQPEEKLDEPIEPVFFAKTPGGPGKATPPTCPERVHGHDAPGGSDQELI
jgi:hypothetical protein